MLAACCFAWFAAQTHPRGRQRYIHLQFAREMTFLVAPFVVLVAAHYLFRYGLQRVAAQTYYAKHVRPWYESGFRYLWSAALETGLYLLLPLAFLALRTRWRICRNGSYALPLLCVASHMAYLLPIGGDYFEYRPLDFYWPLLAFPRPKAFPMSAPGLRPACSVAARPGQRVRWETYRRLHSLCWLLFYANAINAPCCSRRRQYANTSARLHIANSMRRTLGGCSAPGDACARRHLHRFGPARLSVQATLLFDPIGSTLENIVHLLPMHI